MDAPVEPESDSVPEAQLTSDIPSASIEQRLDALVDSSNSCVRLATRTRSALTTLTENLTQGKAAAARANLQKAADLACELEGEVSRLDGGTTPPLFEPGTIILKNYVEELIAALAAVECPVTKGPEPYWLAYPAWFKVESVSKSGVQVTLNGNRLDTIRPSRVAELIRMAVFDSFDPDRFADILRKVRQLLRRVGVDSSSLALDAVYEVLTITPSGSHASGDAFTRWDFYYSVHRLAEKLAVSGSTEDQLRLPPANRSDTIFFSRDGTSRRYLLVEFKEGPTG